MYSGGGAPWGRSVLRAAQYGGGPGTGGLAPRPRSPSSASDSLRPQQFAPRLPRAAIEDNSPASGQSWEAVTLPRKPVQSGGILCPCGLARMVRSRQGPHKGTAQGSGPPRCVPAQREVGEVMHLTSGPCTARAPAVRQRGCVGLGQASPHPGHTERFVPRPLRPRWKKTEKHCETGDCAV